MSEIDQLFATVERLAERVAKLEARLPEEHTATCEAGFGRCYTDHPPLASGQLASAGEAPTVPTGWKLAPGWEARGRLWSPGGAAWMCDEDACMADATFSIEKEKFAGACAIHAAEMGALVRDEPPAEQPSRQETPGGETGEAIDWSRFVPTEEIADDLSLSAYNALVVGDVFASWDLLHGGTVNRSIGVDWCERLSGDGCWWQGRVRLIRRADGRWADGYNPSGPCAPGCGTMGHSPGGWWYGDGPIRYCTPACRDRAGSCRARRWYCRTR